jgi:hypothetical protein
MSYNILADLYADSDFSRTNLFPHCPAYALGTQLLSWQIYEYSHNGLSLEIRYVTFSPFPKIGTALQSLRDVPVLYL